MQYTLKLVWASVLALSGTLACSSHSGRSFAVDAESDCGPVRKGFIDANAPLEADPGQGAAALIAYRSGGEWQLDTTCDTASTGKPCEWDFLITPQGSGKIASYQGVGLEEDEDGVELVRGRSLRFVATARSDWDTLVFKVTPGATVRFDTILGTYCGHSYVYWVSQGAMHPGAPSNPLDLTPLSP